MKTLKTPEEFRQEMNGYLNFIRDHKNCKCDQLEDHEVKLITSFGEISKFFKMSEEYKEIFDKTMEDYELIIDGKISSRQRRFVPLERLKTEFTLNPSPKERRLVAIAGRENAVRNYEESGRNASYL